MNFEELIATADEDEEDWDEENVSVTEVEDGTETGKLTEGELQPAGHTALQFSPLFFTTGSASNSFVSKLRTRPLRPVYLVV